MAELEVKLGERSYPIMIGHGLLEQAAIFGEHIPHRDVLVVSNETVAPLYLERVLTSLQRDARTHILPDGERHKTLATASGVMDAMIDAGFGRDAAVVALGGGVVGDIAGFAAACVQRGVDLVQIPTTLLAQVDSSVGGKTGVNHSRGKNLIGAFHQPRCVIIDPRTLDTLPLDEYRAGIAEVIKYGLIRDAAFLGWLEDNIEALLGRDPETVMHAIRRSCEIKAEVVAADEREAGLRALLNFGHTFGHAIEVNTGYQTWRHGEAVAVGSVLAAGLSERLGLLQPDQAERVRRLISAAGLPVQPPPGSVDDLLTAMHRDKKVRDRRLHFILLEQLGHAKVSADVPEAVLIDTLRAAGLT